jgi:hypothetical protein
MSGAAPLCFFVVYKPDRGYFFILLFITLQLSGVCWQIVYFHTKNPSLDIFSNALECKSLIKFMAIWYFCGHLVHLIVIWCILWSFGSFCGHLVHFVVIWYILWSFGTFFIILYQDKFGNPVATDALRESLMFLLFPDENHFIFHFCVGGVLRNCWEMINSSEKVLFPLENTLASELKIWSEFLWSNLKVCFAPV